MLGVSLSFNERTIDTLLNGLRSEAHEITKTGIFYNLEEELKKKEGNELFMEGTLKKIYDFVLNKASYQLKDTEANINDSDLFTRSTNYAISAVKLKVYLTIYDSSTITSTSSSYLEELFFSLENNGRKIDTNLKKIKDILESFVYVGSKEKFSIKNDNDFLMGTVILMSLTAYESDEMTGGGKTKSAGQKQSNVRIKQAEKISTTAYAKQEIPQITKNYIDLLKVLDTFHDFWKERGKKLTEDFIDDGKMEALHTAIINLLNEKYRFGIKSATPDVKDILGALTSYTITSAYSKTINKKPVAYEPQVEMYFEENIKELYGNTRDSITYEQILESWEKHKPKPGLPELWLKYKKNNLNGSILTIDVLGTKNPKYLSVKGFTDSQKNVIGNFILNFMYAEKGDDKIGSESFFFTFDAVPKRIKTIFENTDFKKPRLTQVYNMVTPANIADSAGTEVDPFNGKDRFEFPTVTFDNNVYTIDRGIQFSITNNGYSEKNRYGFKFEIGQTGGNKYIFPFSQNQNTGASVNYLADVLQSKNVAGAHGRQHNKKMVNIDKLGELETKIKGTLFDIKRFGDYSQVESAVALKSAGKNMIVGTVDLLCGVYSRLRKQNTIWHNADKLILYRFRGKDLTPEEKEKQKIHELKYEAVKKLQELQIVEKLSVGGNAVCDQISEINEKIKKYVNTRDASFRESKDSRKNEKINFVIIHLIKIRLLDIYKFLATISEKCVAIENESLAGYKGKLKEFIEKVSNDVTITNQEEIERIIKTPNYSSEIVSLMRENMNLTPNQGKILSGTYELDINFNTFVNDGSFIFKTKGGSECLKLSNSLFANLYDALDKIDVILNPNSISGRSGRQKNVWERLSNNEIEYFKYVNELMNSFFDKEIGARVYNLLQPLLAQPEAGLTNYDQDIRNWLNADFDTDEDDRIVGIGGYDNTLAYDSTKLLFEIKQQQQIIPVSEGGTKSSEQPVQTFKARKKNEINERNVDQLQYYDMNDLLKQVSGQANNFLTAMLNENSKLINAEPDNIIKPNDIFKFIDDHTDVKESAELLLDNMLFTLESGLISIQNSDDYRYVATNTEVTLLQLLYQSDDNILEKIQSLGYDIGALTPPPRLEGGYDAIKNILLFSYIFTLFKKKSFDTKDAWDDVDRVVTSSLTAIDANKSNMREITNLLTGGEKTRKLSHLELSKKELKKRKQNKTSKNEPLEKENTRTEGIIIID